MKYTGLLILLSLLLSCDKQIEIQNTIWQYDYGNGRFDELKFFERNYIQYSAEIGEHYYGTYRINGDTIILHQEKGEFDDEFNENSRHQSGESTFSMLLKNGGQLGYMDNWQENHWLENYFFTQVDSISK